MKNTVRVERAILDITQQQLANAVGVSRNTIISIESGRYLANSALNVPSGAFSNVPSVTDSNVPLQMWLL